MDYDREELYLVAGIDPQLGDPDPYDPLSYLLPGGGDPEPGGNVLPADWGDDIPGGGEQPWPQGKSKVEDEPPKGGGGSTPGAVTVRPDNWDEGASTYRLAWGDTLTGLAASYLDSGSRWREIWLSQSDQFRATRSFDKLSVGEVLKMLAEALANFRAMMSGKKSTPPGTPKPPGVKGPIWPWIAGGLAVAAVVGGGVYLVTR